jgi:hypothetical protein
MNKILACLLAVLSGSVLSAASPELTVADHGKSDYKIVYAESGTAEINAFIKDSAKTLQEIVKLASGAELPVLPESAFKADSPAIFVGRVSALKKYPEEKRWASHILADGKNIFLWGDDRRCGPPDLKRNDAFRSFILGTRHAVLLFAQKFAGAVFLVMPDLKYSVPASGRIAVPGGFRCDRIPQIEYCIARGKGLNYDLGNNFRSAPWNRTFGGHSHDKAIPWQKYWKTHPEYFWKSAPDKPPYCYKSRPQYCLSNPEVRELIYRHLLSEFDRGYDQVQLGQSDSFHPCRCSSCIKDRGRLSAGEYLWRMHRDMALRLMKDRPGKRLVIMAYGPTWEPPKSFDRFLPNVTIELASFDLKAAQTPRSTWQRWKNFRCPKAVYLYTWGYYNYAGFTPNADFEALAAQVKIFLESGVTGIYRCGFGEQPGLEGPEYYIFGQLLDEPDADVRVLLRRYCARAFAKAGPVMEKFFLELDEAVKSKEPVISDWNKDIDPSRKQFRRFDLELLAARYPKSRLDELEKLLKQAESLDRTPMLQIVRTEFDLLKHSAGCAALFRHGMKERTAESAAAFMDAVRERSAYIDSLPADAKGVIRMNDVILYGGQGKSVLKGGGRLNCLFNAPFHWNLDFMKKENILPFGRTLIADGRDTQYLVPMCVDDKTASTVDFRTAVQVRASLEGSKLKVTLIGKDLNPEIRKKLRIRLKIGPDKASRHQVFGGFGNGAFSDSIPKGFVRNPKICGQQENWIASKAMRPLIKCPASDTAEISIPLDKIRKELPAPGEKWLFNVAVYAPGRTFAGGLVWECALDHPDWLLAFEREGTLLFPERK